jgi:hemerythrin
VRNLIYWQDDYRIGINHIDDQHKKLFLIAEELYSLFNEDKVLNKTDKMIVILSELKDYTIYHFNFEESYMKEINYEDYNSHKLAHTQFIDKVNSVKLNEIGENLNEHILGLLEYMIKWLYLHILNIDQKLIPA